MLRRDAGGRRADGPERPARDGGRRGARGERRADHPQRRPLRRLQLLPVRLPTRREARDARLLPAACGSGRRSGSRRGRGSAADSRGRPRARRSVRGRRVPRCPAARCGRAACGGGASRCEHGRSCWPAARSGPRSSCSGPGYRLPSGLVGRNLHIHPAAWIGALFDEEVRGWDGVMQSYYVDEWHEMGLLMEATFTPLAFGGQWLPGTGHEHAERLLSYDRLGSNGVHLSRRVLGPGRGSAATARPGSRTASHAGDARKLQFGIARAAEIFFAAGATRGLLAGARDAGDQAWPGGRVRGRRSAPRRAAPGGLPSDGDRADGLRPEARSDRPRRRACTAPRTSTSPTPASCPPRSG